MKRMILVLTLALVVLSAVACAGGGGAGLTLGSAPWQDGEEAVYDVVDQGGRSLGTSTFGFASQGAAWALTDRDAISNVDQKSTVLIDAQTLKPLSLDKTIEAEGTDAVVKATYPDGAGKMAIQAMVNGANKDASVDVPANALDNDQILMTLRAAPLDEGYQASFVNVIAARAAKVNTTVRVLGKETVTVPAGTFEAWRVELNFSGTKQAAWYEVAMPHRLVQYDNGATKMLLTKG